LACVNECDVVLGQQEMSVQSKQQLEQASLHVLELEESLTGKQTALDQLLAENEELKAQVTLLSSLDSVVSVFCAAFHWARNLISTGFPVGNFIS